MTKTKSTCPAKGNDTSITPTPEVDDQSELTAKETKAYGICERKIERGLNTFLVVAKAFQEIRDHRYFRQSHRTFARYCCSTWEFGEVTPDILSQAIEVGDEVINAGNQTEVQATGDGGAV